jgi:hypothetical protein
MHVAIASPLRPPLRQSHDAPGSQWHEGFPAFENGRNEERYFCSTLLAQRELHKRAAAFTPPLQLLDACLENYIVKAGRLQSVSRFNLVSVLHASVRHRL